MQHSIKRKYFTVRMIWSPDDPYCKVFVLKEASCNGLLRFGYGQFSLCITGKVHNMFFFTTLHLLRQLYAIRHRLLINLDYIFRSIR